MIQLYCGSSKQEKMDKLQLIYIYIILMMAGQLIQSYKNLGRLVEELAIRWCIESGTQNILSW